MAELSELEQMISESSYTGINLSDLEDTDDELTCAARCYAREMAYRTRDRPETVTRHYLGREGGKRITVVKFNQGCPSFGDMRPFQVELCLDEITMFEHGAKWAVFEELLKMSKGDL